ncbi:effector-associated domain 2-containing protein [Actinomadura parmotrematis]|uniref:Effector-associated domain-containing protein n=1 Tax=Actinomadura parmotrematis TaxID=2864039 RepID=A0ABS7G5E6_9ACTN|nr:hypothetical protein [Actinomadura parmotrematis]MBW8486848.1 hypothetical protein [Actinomadura parmotrematis]
MGTGSPGAVRAGWYPTGRCPIFACDIVSFGAAERTDHVQRHLRAQLYECLTRAFDAAKAPLADCYSEDRGDGAFVVPPPSVPADVLLAPLVDLVDGELRRQHALASAAASIRLRAALHVGAMESDGHGIVGTAVNHAFRLMEAPAFKEAGAAHRLALIVSDRFHEDVVRRDEGLVDPSLYRPLEVVSKETTATGWVRLLGPPDGPAGAGGGPGDLVPRRGEVERARPEPASAGSVPADRPFLAPQLLFVLAERVLDVPVMAREQGRNRVVDALRPDIAHMIARQPEARLDVFGIVQTCMDHPGGLRELVAALRLITGDSGSVARLQDTLDHLFPPGP